MFYKFAAGFSHESCRLPVIWEVETALAAALMSSIDSGHSPVVADIGTEALAVLKGGNFPPDLLSECCAELEHVLDSEQDALRVLAARTADDSQKDSLWVQLKADAGKVRASIDADDEFAAYQFVRK